MMCHLVSIAPMPTAPFNGDWLRFARVGRDRLSIIHIVSSRQQRGKRPACELRRQPVRWILWHFGNQPSFQQFNGVISG
jgi:hypothetical protein